MGEEKKQAESQESKSSGNGEDKSQRRERLDKVLEPGRSSIFFELGSEELKALHELFEYKSYLERELESYFISSKTDAEELKLILQQHLGKFLGEGFMDPVWMHRVPLPLGRGKIVFKYYKYGIWKFERAEVYFEDFFLADIDESGVLINPNKPEKPKRRFIFHFGEAKVYSFP
uniref:Uncharacterized protein n=1 Tax=Thermofilum adornatum TaxID=1365176 RepID=A0A7C1CCJ3_9CREN